MGGGGGQMGGGGGKNSEFWAGVPQKKEKRGRGREEKFGQG